MVSSSPRSVGSAHMGRRKVRRLPGSRVAGSGNDLSKKIDQLRLDDRLHIDADVSQLLVLARNVHAKIVRPTRPLRLGLREPADLGEPGGHHVDLFLSRGRWNADGRPLPIQFQAAEIIILDQFADDRNWD